MNKQTRYFTVEEANRTLPLVRRIVDDIMKTYPAFQRRLQAFHEMAVERSPDEQADLDDMRAELDDEAERINAYIRELEDLGCYFKGFDEGLVDFHAKHDGKPILLCWKLGEERITHWHELDTGYSARQPLTPDMTNGEE